MTYRVARIATLVVTVGLLPLMMFAATVPTVGSLAPEFSLTSQEDMAVKLTDYRGKWVVLYFYPKDFTSGCTIEAHNFQRDQPQYQQRDVVVFGVSVDSADSHKQLHERRTELQTASRHRSQSIQRLWFVDQPRAGEVCFSSHLHHQSRGQGGQSIHRGESEQA